MCPFLSLEDFLECKTFVLLDLFLKVSVKIGDTYLFKAFLIFIEYSMTKPKYLYFETILDI